MGFNRTPWPTDAIEVGRGTIRRAEHLVFAGAVLAVAVAPDRTLPLVAVLAVVLLVLHRKARDTQADLDCEHDSLHDALTGLPNRTLFRDRLDQAGARASRTGGSFSVMVLDLDGFKEVNDTLGHHVGDVLLQRVALRLQSTLRACDTVARIGGDEFAVLVPELADPRDASDAAHRLVLGLREPFELPDQDMTLALDASVGVACYPEHGEDVEPLLERADTAMYSAKRLRSGYELYMPERDRSSRRRLQLAAELPAAILAEQLLLHFQPKARLADGVVTSAEALVRWRHPEHGLVGPDEFIPLAERSGVMRPLTSHVLAGALSQWRSWQDRGMDLAVSVNLSAQNFHDLRLPDEVGALLSEWDVPARYLQLEVTEAMLTADPARAENLLGRLASMGVLLEIDDFGTGYSSLADLNKLPVNGIKIDGSFVQKMSGAGGDDVVVRSTIELAKNLSLEVAAEGVEDAETRRPAAPAGVRLRTGVLPHPAAARGRLRGVVPRQAGGGTGGVASFYGPDVSA